MKCDYCGEREASKVIINPNDLVSYWNVCNRCYNMIIKTQKMYFKKEFNSLIEEVMVE